MNSAQYVKHRFYRLAIFALGVIIMRMPCVFASDDGMMPTPAWLLENVATDTVFLDEDQAVSMAFENDARLAVARAEVNVFQGKRAGVLRPDDPELRAGYAWNWRDTGNYTGQATEEFEGYDAALRIYTVSPWHRNARRKQADAELHGSRSALEAVEQRVASAVRTDFLELQRLTTQIKSLEYLRQLLDDKKALFDLRFEHRHATADEVLRVAAQMLKTVNEMSTLRRDKYRLRRSLAARIGMPPEDIIVPPARPGVRQVPEKPRMPFIAMANRQPEVIYGTWHLAAAEAALKGARADYYPWMSHLQVGYADNERSGNNSSWEVQAAVTIPLFSWLCRADNVARGERLMALAQLDELRRRMESELFSAWAEWRDAEKNYQRMIKEARPLLQQMHATLAHLENQADTDGLRTVNLKELVLETERMLVMAWFAAEQARRAYGKFYGNE